MGEMEREVAASRFFFINTVMKSFKQILSEAKKKQKEDPNQLSLGAEYEKAKQENEDRKRAEDDKREREREEAADDREFDRGMYRR